jgi:uncharacterized radical SAM superfamily protein
MVYTFYPSRRTLTISLTGAACSLMCDHCNAVYLKSMLTMDAALKIIKNNPGKYVSALISGGSTLEGKVPVAEHLPFIKTLYDMGIKLNLHTGLISEKEIKAIKPYAERVSFDFVYDNEVIHNVYHLVNKTREDYEKTYLLMRRIIGGKVENESGFPSTKVVPHFTIGLNCGKVTKGDFDTIEELAFLKPTLLVLDVFIPTKGTPFANCPTPSIDDVREVINKASRRLTHTTLFLGCMRPFGEYREALDLAAYEEGVKGFVLPSKPLLRKVNENKEEVVKREECCALI